jgi:hypothetical protein
MKFVEWLTEQEQQEMPDAKDFEIIGCVLHLASQKDIVRAAQEFMQQTTSSLIPKHWTGYAHHMTVKYMPNISDMRMYEKQFGKPFLIEIEAFAADDKCIAAAVKSPVHTDRPIPHITIATSPEINPVYSNDLLRDRSKWKRFVGGNKLYSYLLAVKPDKFTVWPTTPGELARPTFVI